MTSAEAAVALGVSRATLYSYVSRKMLASQAVRGSPHARAYRRADVERLRRATEEHRNPSRAASNALRWGLPVLDTSICFLDGKRIYYRGHDAVALARTTSLEAVASLLWTGSLGQAFEPTRIKRAGGPANETFVHRAQILLAAAAAGESGVALDQQRALTQHAWRVLQLTTRAAVPEYRGDQTPEQALARAWNVRSTAGVDVLRSVLILCADHELNLSTFVGRCVASSRASPYAVALACLAALSGSRHGGGCLRAEAMLAALRRERDVARAVRARVKAGMRVEGFGHALYPDGDPRAVEILRLLKATTPESTEMRFVERVAATTQAATREHPNLDFALAATARVLRLPTGSSLVLLAIGRTIGWMAHAIEQYSSRMFVRPRARYVGPAAGITA